MMDQMRSIIYFDNFFFLGIIVIKRRSLSLIFKGTIMNFTKIKADLHLHSRFSSDGRSTVREMAVRAIEKGLQVIALTDHIDVDYPEPQDTQGVSLLSFPKLDLQEYRSEIEKVRQEFRLQIDLLVGIEVGLQPEKKILKETARMIRGLKPDFVIGSTHCVLHQELSSAGLFKNRDRMEAYSLYLKDLLLNISLFDHFDSIGHLDFIERYPPLQEQENPNDRLLKYEEFHEIIDQILMMAIRKDKAIELNSSGIRYGLGKRILHPSLEVIKRYRHLGGKLITVGSDAHRAEDIGADFDIAEEYMKEAGFSYYCIYRNRIPEFRKLSFC